nr:unnamed protein product [Callosobruchus chinensis]
MECVKCKISNNEPSLRCDSCESLVHHDCSGLSASELKVMTLRSRRILKYYCDDCQLGLKLLPKLVKKVEELTSEVEKLKASFVAPVDTNAQDFEEVLHEIEERNSRKCNIILYGVAENKDATRQQQEIQDVAEVTKILEFLSPDINTNVKPMRLGKFDRSSTRLGL